YLILGSEQNHEDKSIIKFKDLTINLKTYTVTKDEKEISLTAKELKLLKFFVSHPEQEFTKTQLFRHVWEDHYIEDDNTVMVHIRKLRKKIEDNPSNQKYKQTDGEIDYKYTGEKDELIYNYIFTISSIYSY